MSTTTSTEPSRRLADARVPLSDRIGEPAFYGLCLVAAVVAVGVLVWIAETVFDHSSTAFSAFGLGFLGETTAARNIYGAAALIYGTFVTSFIALILATPTAIFIAIYLTELAPQFIRRPVAILVELLAAIPSVILGLWGIIVLAPFISNHLEPFLHSFLGWFPLFSGTPSTGGFSMLNASLILTIMVLPIITSLTREIFATTGGELKEGAYALGSTRWEMIRMTVLPIARPGIVGAAVLGLGRALGEAIAVTQVIGNLPQIKASLFQEGATLASWIANEYQSANPGVGQSSLIYLAAILLVLSLIVNIGARLIVRRFQRVH